MAKHKKRKTGATVAGVATGLAAAAANGLMRAAVDRLGNDAKSQSAVDGDDRTAKKKSKKRSKKEKRAKKGSAKETQSAEDGAIELLADLATSARKRLAKLADKLESVTSKRRALLQELGALQQGITAALERFQSGSDPAEETPVKPSKKPPRRKAAASDRSRSSRRPAEAFGDDGQGESKGVASAAGSSDEASGEA